MRFQKLKDRRESGAKHYMFCTSIFDENLSYDSFAINSCLWIHSQLCLTCRFKLFETKLYLNWNWCRKAELLLKKCTGVKCWGDNHVVDLLLIYEPFIYLVQGMLINSSRNYCWGLIKHRRPESDSFQSVWALIWQLVFQLWRNGRLCTAL